MYNKLALGTVQFGMRYGVSNVIGKVQFDQVKLILDAAYDKSIRFIDTAPTYGDSESIIGDLAKSHITYLNVCEWLNSHNFYPTVNIHAPVTVIGCVIL